MSIVAEAGDVVTAILSQDPWEMKTAFKTNGMWLFSLILTFVGGFAAVALYRVVPFLERHLERGISVLMYLIIAWIIFSGVVDRFVFSRQVPWSTTIPPYLFMIMAWFGCAYNVKLRTHLSFNEFRMKMARPMQMFALSVDAVLWTGFCWIVVSTTLLIAANSADNFAIVAGTDDMMQWWFIATMPLAFTLMAGRVIGNWMIDWANFRSGDVLIQQAVIGADV
ncbi:MAG: TRAP transporter small permease subunit [Pseudoruegeria sp.]